MDLLYTHSNMKYIEINRVLSYATLWAPLSIFLQLTSTRPFASSWTAREVEQAASSLMASHRATFGKEELSIPSAGLQPCNMQFHWSVWLMGKRHTYSEIYAVNISKLHIHVQTCQRTAASELLNSWHANTCCPCCSLPPLCRDVLHPIIICNQPWPTLEPYQSQESCCWRATHLSRRCPPWYEPHEELASNPDGIWWDVQPQSTLCRGVILRAHSAWHTASSHFPTIWWSQGLAPCWALEEDHPLPLHVRLLAI